MDPHTNTNNARKLKNVFFIGVACVFSLFLLGNLYTRNPSQVLTTKAVAYVKGDSRVTGTITFLQSSSDGPVTVVGHLTDMDPKALRGFHIHQYGDLTNGCLSAGPHFNPTNSRHGAREDDTRHVGDLGNIQTDEVGVASFTFKDPKITLNGHSSILGRAVVIHAGTDDLGRGNNEESLKTGNAGLRAACGVIGA